MTHICVGKLTIIGSDNGLSPWRHQAIIWSNAGLLLIRHLGTNFSEILIGIQTFSFKKMHLKMSSAKWRPFCLGLNELICVYNTHIFIIFSISIYGCISLKPDGSSRKSNSLHAITYMTEPTSLDECALHKYFTLITLLHFPLMYLCWWIEVLFNTNF